MKKLLITSVLFITIISSSLAAGKDAHVYTGAKSLKKSFPEATNASIKTLNEITKISFTSGNENYEVFYSDNGELIAQSKHVKLESLSKGSVEVINKEYRDWTITEAIEFISEAEDTTHYYVSLETDGGCIILEANSDGSLSVYKK